VDPIQPTQSVSVSGLLLLLLFGSAAAFWDKADQTTWTAAHLWRVYCACMRFMYGKWECPVKQIVHKLLLVFDELLLKWWMSCSTVVWSVCLSWFCGMAAGYISTLGSDLMFVGQKTKWRRGGRTPHWWVPSAHTSH
jgi:hypothetical protein